MSPAATPRDHLRLDEQLCFALYAASRAMVQAYTPELDRLGITYPQYVAMMVLWEHGATSVKHLGERLMLDSGTLTPLLKRLEQQGFVTRTRSTEDERVVIVELTAQGRRLRDRARAVPEKIACKSGLSPAELVRLRTQLKDLVATLRGADDDT